MKKAVYMEDMTYRMIEHIAKKNSKTVLDFLTASALQEYQKIDQTLNTLFTSELVHIYLYMIKQCL